MKIAFFGSSLVSSYLNCHAIHYRGLLKALAGLGHAITFFEPDAFGRQRRRDISDPPWARVAIYPAISRGWHRALAEAVRCDLPVKASCAGVFDAELEQAVRSRRSGRKTHAGRCRPDPAAARARVFVHRTYERRARGVEALLEGMTQKGEAAA